MTLSTSILFHPATALHYIVPYAQHHSLVHGVAHWARVHRFGLTLSKKLNLTEPEKLSIALFAWCHDLARTDDSGNQHHAYDGACYVEEIVNCLFKGFPEDVLQMAQIAIKHHSDSMNAEEAQHAGKIDTPFSRESTLNVLGCCWDADRLDLLRLNIIPEETRMSTTYWKELLPLSSKLNKQKALFKNNLETDSEKSDWHTWFR